MEYQEFLYEVEKKMNQKLKGGITASVHIAVKNNGRIKKGILIEDPAVNISPTIYLEEFYEQFQQGEPFESILLEVMRFYEAVKYEEPWDTGEIESYEAVRDKIIFKMIHTKRNHTLLSEVPHIEVLDLSLVFYVLLEVKKNGTAAMLIRNEHLELWGITGEGLFSLARENAGKLLPARIYTMREMVEEVMDSDPEALHDLLSVVSDESERMEKERKKRDVMYVLTNSIRSFGAACLMYPGMLEAAANVLKENYYILPSSVHEVILVPESKGTAPEEMAEIVREINATQVEEEEQLSDHVYFYERRKKKLMTL